MLEKLAENHKKWVKIAYNMCKCKETANDIVQDMYLKVYEINKDLDDGYIYFIIRSIFIDSIRKKKEFAYDFNSIELYNKNNKTNGYKSKIDTEYILFDFSIEYDITEDLKKECYDKAYKKLEKHEKIIIHFSSINGLREFSRQSELSISLIQKIKTKFKRLVWEQVKKYEELETLYQKQQV